MAKVLAILTPPTTKEIDFSGLHVKRFCRNEYRWKFIESHDVSAQVSISMGRAHAAGERRWSTHGEREKTNLNRKINKNRTGTVGGGGRKGKPARKSKTLIYQRRKGHTGSTVSINRNAKINTTKVCADFSFGLFPFLAHCMWRWDCVAFHTHTISLNRLSNLITAKAIVHKINFVLLVGSGFFLRVWV